MLMNMLPNLMMAKVQGCSFCRSLAKPILVIASAAKIIANQTAYSG
jgi:hypothetical protein